MQKVLNGCSALFAFRRYICKELGKRKPRAPLPQGKARRARPSDFFTLHKTPAPVVQTRKIHEIITRWQAKARLFLLIIL